MAAFLPSSKGCIWKKQLLILCLSGEPLSAAPAPQERVYGSYALSMPPLLLPPLCHGLPGQQTPSRRPRDPGRDRLRVRSSQVRVLLGTVDEKQSQRSPKRADPNVVGGACITGVSCARSMLCVLGAIKPSWHEAGRLASENNKNKNTSIVRLFLIF